MPSPTAQELAPQSRAATVQPQCQMSRRQTAEGAPLVPREAKQNISAGTMILASYKEQSEESRDEAFGRTGEQVVLGGGCLEGPHIMGVAGMATGFSSPTCR